MLLALLLACTGPTPEDSAAPIVCVDDSGVEHAVGESWEDVDCPVISCTCLEDGFTECTDLDCA
jgi:hypothetical protein